MADAKIVDIKGVQWELKDAVARNKIITLENVLQTKANEIKTEIIGSGVRDFRVGTGYFSIQVTVPDGYKCLCVMPQWSHIGQLIISLSTPINFKGKTDIYGAYYAFKESLNENVSIIGLLIKEN